MKLTILLSLLPLLVIAAPTEPQAAQIGPAITYPFQPDHTALELSHTQLHTYGKRLYKETYYVDLFNKNYMWVLIEDDKNGSTAVTQRWEHRLMLASGGPSYSSAAASGSASAVKASSSSASKSASSSGTVRPSSASSVPSANKSSSASVSKSVSSSAPPASKSASSSAPKSSSSASSPKPASSSAPKSSAASSASASASSAKPASSSAPKSSASASSAKPASSSVPKSSAASSSSASTAKPASSSAPKSSSASSVSKPASSSASVSKPASSSASVSKAVSSSVPASKAASSSASISKPVSSSATVSKATSSSGSVPKPASSSASVSKAANSSAPKPSSTSSSSAVPAASGSASTGVSAADQAKFLTLHNDFRAKYSAGPVVWDEALANFALKTAQTCKYGHTGGPYGENIAAGVGGGYNIDKAFSSWANEDALYDFSKPGYSSATGHFTQIVWKGTGRVGCAAASCADGTIFTGYRANSTYVVCEYQAPGNVVSSNPTRTAEIFTANVGPKVA